MTTTKTKHVGRAPRVAKRIARGVIRALMHSPLRAGTLALVRRAVRVRSGFGVFGAPAFYAGEALAEGGGEMLGRLRTGSQMHLLAVDEVHRYIYFYGEFEEPTTRFLQSVVRPGWTFVDVGANAGYFTLLAHDLGGPGTSVHAFEPNPVIAQLLERSARRVSSDIRVVRAACGERPGTADLHLSTVAANSGLSSLRPDVLPASASRLQVPVIALDGYCAENHVRPDVIKIDVEGHEEAVLLGADVLLSEGVPRYVVCELVSERVSALGLITLLAQHDYSAYSIEDDGRLVPYRPLPFQNVVFRRAGG